MAEHINNNKFMNPSQVYDCDAGSGLRAAVNTPGIAYHRCQLSGQFEIEVRVDYDGTPTERLFFYLCKAEDGTKLKTFLHDYVPMPTWVEYSDPSYWTNAINVTWEGSFWRTAFNTIGSLDVNGTWATGKRWEDIRVQLQNPDEYFGFGPVYDTNSDDIAPASEPTTYYCYEERALIWGSYDLFQMNWDARYGAGVDFKIFFNEGVAWAPAELVWVERTTDAFWTPWGDDGCYDDSYYDSEGWHQDGDCSADHGWWLDVLGSWATGYRPKQIRLTCDAAFMTEIRLYDADDNIRQSWVGSACATKTLDICFYQNKDIASVLINGDWTVAPCHLTKIEFGDARIDESGEDAPYVVDGFGFRYMGSSLDKYPFYWKITRNAANLIQCYYKEGGAGAWQNCPESFTDADILCLGFEPNNQSNFRVTKIQLDYYAMSQWVSYLTDNFWSLVTGTWTGTGWAPSVGIIRIDRKGTVFPWYQLFRPTKLKVTFTGGGTVNLTLYDFTSHVLYQNASYASGTEVTLSWLSDDLYYLYITGSPTEVTNIEFYCEGVS
jgi:hypothetical protein